MANTLVMVDCRGQVTVFYLSLHGVKVKGNASKLSKQFNLDISLYDPNQAQVEVENPYAPKSTIAKMQSFFKQAQSGKFLIKDSLAFKNLRLQQLDPSEEATKQRREEH